ncbi:PQQ-dependent sugar dehydrogenase [Reinekea marinisedimentorum]|uniref:Glucose/arabinose dehydrogenase n=1 Tax=Reinekea marinisedimentorum TaxID=230495 RepID=A0A4R3I1G2_9GAMM|nr:PQQ-dependent sugar dehydrogenase [Reinekea marinisedimentorum]TCS38843.1 glucose/arabinose dehydrogenase [Reinekea marinisedimentorum]
MRRLNPLTTTLFISLFSFAGAGAETERSTAIGDVTEATVNYRLEEITDGLNHPSSIAFLAGGNFLLAERDQGLTVLLNGQKISVSGLPEIYTSRQAGLHDVALHPNFSRNRLIYFSYSSGSRSGNTTALARAKLVIDTTQKTARLEQLEQLFYGRPLSKSSAHYGGRILFLPDGTLLLTLGEGYSYKEQAQKLDNTLGKVVRLHDDGSIPDDNPFVNTRGALPEIYSYGHRNPQGLILTERGDVLLHEHGPRGGDEINRLQKGKNYGWPEITYGIDYSGAPISLFTEKPGMQQSIVHYVPSIAPSGFTQYNGSLFPNWQGDLFLGGLVSRQVRHIDINEDGSFGTQQKLFTELKQRIRDVETGPDGALYFVTDDNNGRLYRVIPK